MAHQVDTYGGLLQQIHNDLRIQHPEWIQPNGESYRHLRVLEVAAV